MVLTLGDGNPDGDLPETEREPVSEDHYERFSLRALDLDTSRRSVWHHLTFAELSVSPEHTISILRREMGSRYSHQKIARKAGTPINHVSPHAPAMLLMFGTLGRVVGPGNMLRLAQRLRSAGDGVETEQYQGITHGSPLAAFSGVLSFIAPARADALRFVASGGSCGE